MSRVRATASLAILAIAIERARQVEQEGWTEEHDDEHAGGELGNAAAAYLVLSSTSIDRPGDLIRTLWPWDWSWWKPKDRRRNLVRAGALIVAEIERLDRLEAKGGAK